MANKPIKLKIDVTKILKHHLYKGKAGTYLNCVIWPKKDGKDQYGNTHSVKQEIPREARDGGEEEPFIGDMTVPDDDQPAPRQQSQPSRTKTSKPAPPDDEDEIPF